MSYHIHMSGESRDCDGRYSHGRDIRVPEPIDPDDKRSFEDLKAIEYALTSIYRLPDESPVQIEIDTDSRGRVTIHAGGQTDEGYWRTFMVVCNEDDSKKAIQGSVTTRQKAWATDECSTRRTLEGTGRPPSKETPDTQTSPSPETGP